MSVLTIAQLQSYTDKVSRIYQEFLTICGISTGSSVAGTQRWLAEQLLAISTGAGNYDVEEDLNDASNDMVDQIDAQDIFMRNWSGTVASLNDHLGAHGSETDSTISDIDTMLIYYNGGAGGLKYANLIDPVFSDLYYFLLSVRLTQYGVYGKGIHPSLNSSYTNGMGTKTVAGVFTAGQAYDSNYSEFFPLVEVIVNFAGGGGLPVVTIAGTDDTGSTATTWAVTLDVNNPAAAVATTITPAVTIMARQVVAVASASGIVRGSVLTVNSGLSDSEVIVVEDITGTNMTAVFRKAHNAGAALTGNRTYVTVPSVANRRVQSVSGITLTLSGHAAGTVRVSGRQDRIAI